MSRFFIKGIFSKNWHEVSELKFNEYRKFVKEHTNCTKKIEEFLNAHTKCANDLQLSLWEF